ncbi:MAG: hypothetical protein D6725_01355 [Planctomycetota bacterium]|nr:MAG: hypothetical protein D6725_01355 [Planctomycetota bacterium]
MDERLRGAAGSAAGPPVGLGVVAASVFGFREGRLPAAVVGRWPAVGVAAVPEMCLRCGIRGVFPRRSVRLTTVRPDCPGAWVVTASGEMAAAKQPRNSNGVKGHRRFDRVEAFGRECDRIIVRLL